MSTFTEEHLATAQKAWGDGIVRISTAHKNGEDYEQAAKEHIQNLYNYGASPVLFKPTLAAEVQFRGTFEEALSYFVATNKVCGEDGGFAIKGWTAVRFENTAVLLNGNTAMAMGNYFFTDSQGELVKVEYSFGYVLDDQGEVKIVLHHSSVPYAGQAAH
ncbi:MAG: hypothetical protein P8P32_02985 [Akkermansiaceae bacterium]|nr:hypothetical protein [Akkermansiaceae bacterium]MDG2322981.1 hypothetical protein [Akkermansiaceae bacterium]